AEQQAQFTRVEVYPQALEALFCAACGHPFRVSLDNLNGEAGEEGAFALKVREKAQDLLKSGLPDRPQRWCQVLMEYYGLADRELETALEDTFI
ncbi:MAG TPA: ATPase, partial [Alcanivorax sp.]|nr:ATPase [Alcanivorax sp.]